MVIQYPIQVMFVCVLIDLMVLWCFSCVFKCFASFCSSVAVLIFLLDLAERLASQRSLHVILVFALHACRVAETECGTSRLDRDFKIASCQQDFWRRQKLYVYNCVNIGWHTAFLCFQFSSLYTLFNRVNWIIWSFQEPTPGF